MLLITVKSHSILLTLYKASPHLNLAMSVIGRWLVESEGSISRYWKSNCRVVSAERVASVGDVEAAAVEEVRGVS